MNTSIILLSLLSCAPGASNEHLAPLPVHNGETTNGENWGWIHPESRGGGPLRPDGAARVMPLEQDPDAKTGAFEGHVIALDAGASAITGIADHSGGSITLVPGETYELAWNQGALAADPEPIIAVYLLDRNLKEIPGTRTVETSPEVGGAGWSRRHTRFTMPASTTTDDDATATGHMITFQNLAKSGDPKQSIAAIDKVSLAHVVEDEPGDFEPLFDGRTLEGWTGALKGYRVHDGTIELDTTANAWGNLYTTREFDDFILRFEFKLTPGANNGIGIRAPLGGDAAYQGMELQVLDNNHPKYAGLKPWQYHASIYGVAPARRGFQRAVGDWNQQEIRVEGRTVRVTLNGEVILDQDLDEATKDGTLSGRDHPGLARTSGHIGFCGHGDEVAFRNIRIKPLGASDE
jgi:hypothetical protein